MVENYSLIIIVINNIKNGSLQSIECKFKCFVTLNLVAITLNCMYVGRLKHLNFPIICNILTDSFYENIKSTTTKVYFILI